MISQLNNAVSFLSAPPAFIGQQTASQSLTGGVNTNIVLEKPVFDNYLGQNDVGFIKYNVQPGCAGIWLVNGAVAYGGSSGSNFDAFLNVNGAPVPGAAYADRASVQVPVADLLQLTVGEYVCLMGLAGVNVSTAVGANNFSYLNMRWAANASGTASLTPPNPASWTAGQLCTATNFNQQIYDSVSFLSYVPFFRASQSTSQSVATGTTTGITNLTSTLDNYGAFNLGTNKWDCQVSGTYLVGYQVGFANSSGAAYAAALNTDISSVSTTYWSGAVASNSSTIIGGMKTMRFSAGDTVQLAGWQDSGGSLSTQTSGNTRFFTLWMSS
jgi:hypothetical protein